jgi:hypothetical protein
MYQFTATMTNMLLLSQVVIGATITGLGASDSSPILVTVFGALNTIIAGVVAFLKSRGQPMRARMFKDDLERVVDEIENSAIMWLGISKNAHGYDAIDTDDQVTVRGEVARLTRLYDKAVKTNTLNDPDMYSTGAPGDPHSAALRDRSGQLVVPAAAPPPAPAPVASASAPAPSPAPAAAPPADDPDASPATKPPDPEVSKWKDPEPTATDDKSAKPAEVPVDADKSTAPAKDAAPTGSTDAASASQTAQPDGTTAGSSTSAVGASAAVTEISPDPDESPATAVHPEKHSEDTSKSDGEKK